MQRLLGEDECQPGVCILLTAKLTFWFRFLELSKKIYTVCDLAEVILSQLSTWFSFSLVEGHWREIWNQDRAGRSCTQNYHSRGSQGCCDYYPDITSYARRRGGWTWYLFHVLSFHHGALYKYLHGCNIANATFPSPVHCSLLVNLECLLKTCYGLFQQECMKWCCYQFFKPYDGPFEFKYKSLIIIIVALPKRLLCFWGTCNQSYVQQVTATQIFVLSVYWASVFVSSELGIISVKWQNFQKAFLSLSVLM